MHGINQQELWHRSTVPLHQPHVRAPTSQQPPKVFPLIVVLYLAHGVHWISYPGVSVRVLLKTNTKIESLNKETEDIKNNHLEILELKSIITKVKSSVDGLNSRMEITEEGVSELKDRSIDILSWTTEKIGGKLSKSQGPMEQQVNIYAFGVPGDREGVWG